MMSLVAVFSEAVRAGICLGGSPPFRVVDRVRERVLEPRHKVIGYIQAASLLVRDG